MHPPEKPKLKTALNRSRLFLNRFERDIVANVRKFGWHANYVMADEEGPSFAYSVGFWLNANAPEILICGLPQETGHALLWSLFNAWQEGEPPPVGRPIPDLVEGFNCYFFPISEAAYSEYPLSAQWFYGGNDFPCLQLVWPDRAGQFPWQDGFDTSFSDDQPDLSEGGWVSQLRQ